MRPPRASRSRRRESAVGSVLVSGLVSIALTAGLSTVPSATAAVASGAGAAAPQVETFHVASSSMKIYWRGNGDGHGMSQYGARGAAIKGLTAAQILAFYYPGTQLTTLPASTVRVRLS